MPKVEKISQNSCQAQNSQNIYIKAQFEGPKHLHKTTFKPKYTWNNPYFKTAYLGENVKKLLKQKVAQNVAIFGSS